MHVIKLPCMILSYTIHISLSYHAAGMSLSYQMHDIVIKYAHVLLQAATLFLLFWWLFVHTTPTISAIYGAHITHRTCSCAHNTHRQFIVHTTLSVSAVVHIALPFTLTLILHQKSLCQVMNWDITYPKNHHPYAYVRSTYLYNLCYEACPCRQWSTCECEQQEVND